MFHVERHIKTLVNKGKYSIWLLFFILISCYSSRQTIQIPDYILVPNGKEILGHESINAFLFENNTKNFPIERFLSDKFKTDNYYSSEFMVTIDKNKYKLIVYDNSDFEKYFNSANYSVINLEPENSKSSGNV